MPLYEYKCQDCGQLFEILQRASEDNSSLQCPSCGSSKLRREFSVFNTNNGNSNTGNDSCPTGTCPLTPTK